MRFALLEVHCAAPFRAGAFCRSRFFFWGRIAFLAFVFFLAFLAAAAFFLFARERFDLLSDRLSARGGDAGGARRLFDLLFASPAVHGAAGATFVTRMGAAALHGGWRRRSRLAVVSVSGNRWGRGCFDGGRRERWRWCTFGPGQTFGAARALRGSFAGAGAGGRAAPFGS